MPIPLSTILIAAFAMLALSGCGGEAEQAEPLPGSARDPLVARVLTDPLMSDPDLAHRNEANAALTLRYDHLLPPLSASEETKVRAREAARIALLKDGPIADLPQSYAAKDGPPQFARGATADAILRAAGGPVSCGDQLKEGLVFAADIPAPAAIMPHGMVQQAAGSDMPGCAVRVVRYLAPVDPEDALEWHFTLTERARLRPVLYGAKQVAMVASGRQEEVVVELRPGPNGLTAVDIVHWRK